jgi:hypothetical protein
MAEKVIGRVWLIQVNDGSGWWTFGRYRDRNRAQQAAAEYMQDWPSDGCQVVPDDCGLFSVYEVS